MRALSTPAWLIAAALLAAAPAAGAQQSGALDVLVLEQAEGRHTAREALEAAARYDDSLLRVVERDAGYRRLYLRSPRFASLVRSFADLLLLDAAEVAAASEQALLAEARAWAADRRLDTPPEGILAAHGLEIEIRARLLAGQAESFGTAQLRAHMLDSVPEFFGELVCSWIRLPLADLETGTAAIPDERRARYDELDRLGRALENGKIDWDVAVEKHSVLELDRERKGEIGLLRRDMTHRYEETFLRHAFSGLGFKNPASTLIRGPIMGEQWVYLLRIESVQIRGVVDLQRVRGRVERSLREKLLQERLAELRAGVERRLHVPILQPE